MVDLQKYPNEVMHLPAFNIKSRGVNPVLVALWDGVYDQLKKNESLYRALRKYEHVGILNYELRKGNKGPERKYYYLTALGQELFARFTKRNIHLFYSEEIKTLLNY